MSRAKNVLRLLTMHCEGHARLASESLDRRLTRIERLALRTHLLYCVACRRYQRQVLILRRAAGELARVVDPPLAAPAAALSPEARARIERAVREAE